MEPLESLVILKLIVVLGRRVSLSWAQIRLFGVLVALSQESVKLSNTNYYIRRHHQEHRRRSQGTEDILGPQSKDLTVLRYLALHINWVIR